MATLERDSVAKTDPQAQKLAKLFGLLSDPTRLGILLALRKSPANVTELCRQLGLAQPTISRHLAILRMGELVRGRRRGKEMLYSAGPLPLAGAGRTLRRLLRATRSA